MHEHGPPKRRPTPPPDHASARAEAVDLDSVPPSPRLPREVAGPTERAPNGDPLFAAITNLSVQMAMLTSKVESLLADSGAQTAGMIVARDAAIEAKRIAQALEERVSALDQRVVSLDVATGAVFDELVERVDKYRAEQDAHFEALDRKLFGTAESAMSAHDAVGKMTKRLNMIHALAAAAASAAGVDPASFEDLEDEQQPGAGE